tara:strand:- start:993 stop:1454 length:462 start_codon:yes stop_codon:yes gene_type:complete
MSFTQIHREQLVKTDINTLWDFMSSPKNLETITPESMMFKITSKNKDEKMYPGMIITYIVSPLLKIKLTWMTEITQVKEKSFFIDEQRLGPYTMWHHQHIFKQTEEGILMKDIITYIPPFGIIGKIANFLFIKNKVNQIFNYRNKKIDSLFNN